ncbi:hypothetical protein [Cupriavidus sp. AU9028]|uniref:hypothetical protein n=1 Tax=Cupriavidus sp. AU9028 TaxID=2871157 RepID=UPI001C9520F9|nr:hypothetical protein [Cupriavidus sp. AU9028]MBY4896124.1 hypothetical protein [Cupriavidus sp. AU9028]
MSPTSTPQQMTEQAQQATSRALVPAGGGQAFAADPQQAVMAGQNLVQNYMELTRMTWNFYGTFMEENGFHWAAWWFKWPDERLAQQISSPLPPLSMAMRYSESMMELSADLQGRWLDAWRSLFTMTPGAFLPHSQGEGTTAQ